MGTKVNWGSRAASGKLYFNDLDIGDCFKINTSAAKGAVYRKVYNTIEGECLAEEVATSKLFHPTTSEVVKVNVNIDIDAPKPEIAGY